MFRKIVCGVLTLMFCCSLNGYCIQWQSNSRTDDAIIANLETLDVVRDVKEKWNETSYIQRKDALSMAYIVVRTPYAFGSGRGRRVYCSTVDHQKGESFRNLTEAYSKELNMDLNFVDVAPKDENLVLSLIHLGLLAGSFEEGDAYARLYDELTYEEALVTLLRMLEPRHTSGYTMRRPWIATAPEEAYEIGLVLNIIKECTERPPDVYDPTEEYSLSLGGYGGATSALWMSKGRLSEKITAYDFMRMLYSALYVEKNCGDGSVGRYVDILLSEIDNEMDTDPDDILV